MLNFKNRLKKIKKSYLQVAAVLLLIVLAISLLWFNNSTSMQSEQTLPIKLYFKGEYRVADGEWTPYVEGEHIPATKGDVTLKGNLYMRYEGEDLGIYRYDVNDPEAQKAAFYTNHINLTFCEIDENGEKTLFVIDSENPLYKDSNCGESWTAHPFVSDPKNEIEIRVHNPHSFGNETAIDEMLSTMSLYSGIMFEKEILDAGASQRNAGLLFVMFSIMLLGIAAFSTLIHVKNSRIIWLLGLVVLFAGLYFSYSAQGVSFWSESVVSNTTLLGASMIFYMLFITMIITCLLKGTRKIGNATLIILLATNVVLFVLPIFTDVLFYDTWLVWVAAQSVANIALSVCLVKEFLVSKTRIRWLYIASFLPLIAFFADVFATWLAIWRGGLISKYVFIALFAVAAIMVLKLIPHNINAATKAKELEMEKIVLNAELAESRISTMMSQIRPHFIYNTLGSIEQLCDLDPKKAGELVHDFAKYLRGNFGELDNPKPILMSQEMDHVHHYVSIENVRFPDMTFLFEMNSSDFHIPALTVQPIVENAIKHGLMKLQKGGTIRVISYENETDYCVSVVDDGVGFDTSLLLDERKHVGLRNIRERLKAMVNGSIEIESTVGVGTKVLIKIPKEKNK